MGVNFDVNLVFSNFNKLMSMQTSLEKGLKTADKTTESFKKMEKELDSVNDQLKEVEKRKDAFGTLIKNTVLEKFSDINNKFTKLNNAFKELGGKKSFDITLGDFFKDFGKQSTDFSKNISMIFGSGLKGVFKSLGFAIKGLMVGFKGILAALSPILAPVLALAAAAVILWRAWKQNLGGMQTEVFKWVGAVKDAWAKMVVAFDKSLRNLAPVFKVIFKSLSMIIMPTIKVIEGIFLGLIEIINPIAEAIGAIFEPLAELMGFSTEGEGFKIVLEGISKAFQLLGKTIGFVLRVVLWPVVQTFKFITYGVKELISVFKNLGDASKKMFEESTIGKLFKFLGGWEKLKEIMSWIIDKMQAIGGFFDKMFGKEEEKKRNEETGINREKTIQTMSNLSRPGNSITDNRQFNIHSAGAINEQNAIGITNVLKKDFRLGMRM